MNIEKLEGLFTWQAYFRLIRHPPLEKEFQKQIPLFSLSPSSPTSNKIRPEHDLRVLLMGMQEEGYLGALGI